MTLTVSREYLTVAEAAAIWRISVPTVYRRCAAGSIPHIRVGGGDGPIRIPASAFEASPSLGERPVERRAPSPGAVEAQAHGGEAA
jgi:excisionase family DNA binding protein